MTVEYNGKQIPFEAWIVEDAMMDCEVFATRPGHIIALARLLTAEALDELDLRKSIKNKKVQAVAVIRKSVADMASDYELECLMLHEAAHMAMGHTGQNWEREEKAVREELGEAEVANDLFGIRYLAVHSKIR